MQGIVELPSYIRLADNLLNEKERESLLSYLAEHPNAGVVMEHTGGVRKLRWHRGNQGKSTGVRVIYYYHDEHMPLYLLTIFAKGNKANLSRAERNTLASLVNMLVETWKARKYL